MIRLQTLSAACVCLAVSAAASAQQVKPAPRPPAPVPGTPSEGSAAPDGYAPTPQWLGQTRAPYPAAAKASPPLDVATVAEGFTGAFCFSFLPDGRILVGERPGHIKIVRLRGSAASARQVRVGGSAASAGQVRVGGSATSAGRVRVGGSEASPGHAGEDAQIAEVGGLP